MTAPQQNKAGVNIARPLVFLGLAAAIGLGSLLLPSGGGDTASPPASTAAPSPAQGAACADVRDSLRPQGPLPAPALELLNGLWASLAQDARR